MLKSNTLIDSHSREKEAPISKEYDAFTEYKKNEEISFEKHNDRQIPGILAKLKPYHKTSRSESESTSVKSQAPDDSPKDVDLFNEDYVFKQNDRTDGNLLSSCVISADQNIKYRPAKTEENKGDFGEAQGEKKEDSKA